MKREEAVIGQLLLEEGYEQSPPWEFSMQRDKLLKTPHADTIDAVYKDLGGKGEFPVFDIRYEMVFNETVIRLDDHTHFNRYRSITFRSPVYSQLSGIDASKFKIFCRKYEKECLKSGVREGVWSSPLAERFFGSASAPGDFFGVGSPGWKLQAFNEFLGDLCCLINRRKLVRIPTYDTVLFNNQFTQIGKILKSGQDNNLDPLRKRLNQAIALVSGSNPY